MDSNNYQIIRLTNNTTIVGEVILSPEEVIVLYPLEIYSKPLQDATGKVIGEQMVLRPLLVMTQDSDVVIDIYNILFINRLDEKLISTYEDMATTVYSGKITYEGSAYTGKEQNKKEFTEEEADYLKQALDSMLGNKKDDIVH